MATKFEGSFLSTAFEARIVEGARGLLSVNCVAIQMRNRLQHDARLSEEAALASFTGILDLALQVLRTCLELTLGIEQAFTMLANGGLLRCYECDRECRPPPGEGGRLPWGVFREENGGSFLVCLQTTGPPCGYAICEEETPKIPGESCPCCGIGTLHEFDRASSHEAPLALIDLVERDWL